MADQKYNARYAIGQIIKHNNQYWQIIKIDSPQTGDVFIPNAEASCVDTCPHWLYFGPNDKRYIVTEVNVTPVKETKVKDALSKKKLNNGTVIVQDGVFYEVIDYRTPNYDEFYAHAFSDTNIVVFQRLYPSLPGSNDPFNIVKQIEPYRKGEVIDYIGKSYKVVDYTFPKKDQIIISPPDTTVYINHWTWTMGKAFILEPLTPEPVDPEANAYQPGQLIVRENVVYRVIEYRKPVNNDHYTHSSFSSVHYANKGITKPYWVVEAYCVK